MTDKTITTGQNGLAVLGVKSSKSAVYFLAKHLLAEGDNIVTTNSLGLLRNEVIRSRLGIEVRLAEEQNLQSLVNLVDENTKLIFLETVGRSDYSIPDFPKITTYAKSRGIPVVAENSVGSAREVVNLLNWGVNFFIEDLSYWPDNWKKSAGAILIDGGNYDWGKGIFENFRKENFRLFNFKGSSYLTFLDKPIHFSIANIGKTESSQVPDNSFDLIEQMEESETKKNLLSKTALNLCNWLKENPEVRQVEYLGLPEHKNYPDAVKYLSGAFGNLFSISLSSSRPSFDFFLDDLVPKSFSFFKVTDINYETKRISFDLKEADYEKVRQYFHKSFEALRKYHLIES